MNFTHLKKIWLLFTRNILLGVSCFVLISCSDGSDPAVPGTGPTTNPSGDCSMLLASTEQIDSDFRIELELKGELGECLSPQGRIDATIYGYDEFVADAPATPIMLIDTPALAAGEKYHFRFNRSDLDKVEFQSGVSGALSFYISLYVNIDGTGKICNGDYRQDFDLTDFQSFNETQSVHSMEMFLKEIDNMPCS